MGVRNIPQEPATTSPPPSTLSIPPGHLTHPRKKERKKERKKIRNKQNHNLLVDVRSNFPELGLLAAHKLARVGQIEEEHAHPRLHRRLLPHGERFRSFPQLQLLVDEGIDHDGEEP